MGEGLQQALQTRGLLLAWRGLQMWAWSLRHDQGHRLCKLLGDQCCPDSVMSPSEAEDESLAGSVCCQLSSPFDKHGQLHACCLTDVDNLKVCIVLSYCTASANSLQAFVSLWLL